MSKEIIEEKKELDARIIELMKQHRSKDDTADGEERVRIFNQLNAMQTYSNILNERINAF